MIGELNTSKHCIDLDLPFRAPEKGGGNAVSTAQFEWGTAPGLSRVPCFVQCKCYGSTSGVCNHLATTQFLISHVRSLRRSLDRLSTACKICSFFSCHFLAKRHCWPSVDNVFTFLITLLYKWLTSYSTRLSSLHVQARLGCDAETPSETVRFQDALMKNHSAMWLQSSSDKRWQKYTKVQSFWIILDLSITMLCFFCSWFKICETFTRTSTFEAVLEESAASTAPAVVVEAEQSNVTKAFSILFKCCRKCLHDFRLDPVRASLSPSQLKSKKVNRKVWEHPVPTKFENSDHWS